MIVRKILLLTADALSSPDYDTELLADALRVLGAEPITASWTDDGIIECAADLAIIRSTWDYTTRLEEFVGFLQKLQMPLLNPIDIVQWNLHKGYLVELASAGAPTVPTVLVRSGSSDDMPEIGTAEVIIKPAISAGAIGIGRFPTGSAEALDHLRTLTKHGDALVQPFLEGIAAGERSLIHLGGVYSHAVSKTPAAGDFRVQEKYGGTNLPHVASGAEIEAARSALLYVPSRGRPLLYSRVDLVGSSAEPMVMEVELIEPELFLPFSPGSARTMASAALGML